MNPTREWLVWFKLRTPYSKSPWRKRTSYADPNKAIDRAKDLLGTVEIGCVVTDVKVEHRSTKQILYTETKGDA